MAVDAFHLLTIYVERGVGGHPGSPEVLIDLLGFYAAQDHIFICAPLSKMMDLLPVMCLSVVRHESNHSGVISKLHCSV